MSTCYDELHAHSDFSFLEGASHVEAMLETWRIDDEWWRERAVSRVYFSVLLEDGRTVTVYQDLISGRWARQAY